MQLSEQNCVSFSSISNLFRRRNIYFRNIIHMHSFFTQNWLTKSFLIFSATTNSLSRTFSCPDEDEERMCKAPRNWDESTSSCAWGPRIWLHNFLNCTAEELPPIGLFLSSIPLETSLPWSYRTLITWCIYPKKLKRNSNGLSLLI